MNIENDCYVTHDKAARSIRIGNEIIERVFCYDMERAIFFTRDFTHKPTGRNWSPGESVEFNVTVQQGDRTIRIGNRAGDERGDIAFSGYETEDLDGGGKGLKVTIESRLAPVRIHLYQEIQPGSDWTRRRLAVENRGTSPLTVTEYDPEVIGTPSGLTAFYFCSWRWGGRLFANSDLAHAGTGLHSVAVPGRVVEPVTVPTDSPLLLTDEDEQAFFWFFPEVPIQSVVVREDPQPSLRTHNAWGQVVPAGATADLSAGVVCGAGVGNHRDGFRSFRAYLDRWVVGDNMDSRRAAFVYNSWYALGYTDAEPNEKSCLKQIDAAADLGVDLYVLDAGWQAHCGDWEPDPRKFLHGLKPVADHCHEKGLRFGLWVDCRMACSCSRVYAEHPEWRVRREGGGFYEDEFVGHKVVAMCLGGGFGEWIKTRFVQLVKELELDCLKVDNVMVLSYYSLWRECHADNHDHPPGASHRAAWQQWVEIMDAVRAARPGILIESIPSGLSLLGKQHFVWSADYQHRPDWMREAYFYRALLHHMACTHPPVCIHQGWPSTECKDLHELDVLCASTIGSNVQTGMTGSLESMTEPQKALLKEWIAWWRTNKRYLGVYQHLFEESPPIPLETATDDCLTQTLAAKWEPTTVDGFAHLLPDGGWVFLFNPTGTAKPVDLTLRLADYGVRGFSAVTGVSAFEYLSDSRTLRLAHALPARGYVRLHVQTDCPVRIQKMPTELCGFTWSEENKTLVLETVGPPGPHAAVLAVSGLGPPAAWENCDVEADATGESLNVVYRFPGGMTGGSQGPLRLVLRWS